MDRPTLLPILGLALGAALLLGKPAQAQQTLYVAGYGGSFERMMRERIIPPFEQANNLRVEYVAGQSTATLAKLQAQRGQQELDIAIVDDGPMYQAVQFGFCAPIEASPVLNDLYPLARLDEKAVAFGVGATVPVYNERVFAEKGWAPPASWADLGNPAFRGQLALLGAASTTGLHGLIMVARAKGGGEANIDPGFAAFRSEIRPNVVTFAPSAPKIEELLQSGEISLSVLSRSRVTALRAMGLPIAAATPKEGPVALMTTICPVAKSTVSPAAQAFIRHMLSPEMQRIFASGGYGPVNRTTQLTEKEAEAVPFGAEAVNSLVTLDWPTINRQRAAWTQRWNREIER
ncbi:ABC transporter substrate-binding protein [Roseomonas sp. OT10]|uniref:ABC transporter substrate-binding protein n=1 Tax=Roseomonas cutis TaxID=2897332 RepID=UPI001E3502D4|nr:ABC transporter substrate-binding protein [Roseomonas sp. OT10]UFN47885.1 ABC transporter substrate-binding protein [Roseomonas sp. OT10]